MFEFLLSNWVMFLVVFILSLLILIGYLIDRDDVKKEKITKQKNKNIKAKNCELKKSKDFEFFDPDSLTTQYIVKNQDKFNCFYDDLFKDDNDELDMEFNKLVSKPNIFDEELKKGIENIKIEPIKITDKYQYITNDIILPDIKK